MKAGSLLAVPLPNGLVGVIWLLEAGAYGAKGYFRLVVMEGFHRALPRAAELARLRVAESPSPGLPGEDNVWKACFFGDIPKDFSIVGKRPLPAQGHASFESQGTMVFQDGEHCRAQIFRRWRWLHDRPALDAEWARAAAESEKRAEARRRTLTLPKLLRERIFASVADHWPEHVVREVRRIFRDATRELITLQDGGTKRQRTAVLKRIVSELNVLDDEEGFIETVEREQIVARIESLAALVGISNEGERLTGHRDW